MSRIDEINEELTFLMKKGNWKNDLKRIDQLIEKLEILEPEKSLTLHYDDPVAICQVQLAAKVVKAWLTEDSYQNNLPLIDCPIPRDLEGDWMRLKLLADRYSRQFFYIETPNYGRIRYVLKRSNQITDLESNLDLAIVQKTFKKIRENNNFFDIQDVNNLTESFGQINLAISQFFLTRANENGTFDWNKKYSPCVFDRKRIHDFRRMMMSEIHLDIDKKKLAFCRKYFLRDFAMLIKYLTFWVSLLDVATFPGLNDKYRDVYNGLIDYLLKNYANIYIYDIVVESDVVKKYCPIDTRGSESNTTRIKVFFTKNDDKPQLLRLDLPHIGHPYVHINHQNAEGDINNHIRISSDVTDGTLDKVFEPLVESLQCYNFFTIDTRHSSVIDDKKKFREMRYLSAMYSYAIVAHAYLYLGDDNEIYRMQEEKYWKTELIKLLSEDGYSQEETGNLDTWSLFEFSDTLF